MRPSFSFILLALMALAACRIGMAQTPKTDPGGMTPEQRMRHRMELREKMHKKMMEGILHGRDSSDWINDMEKMMEDTLRDMEGFDQDFSAFSSGSQFSGGPYKSEWQENNKGRTYVITPEDKNIPLDINVEKGSITIKGKMERKMQDGSSFVRDFNSSVSVPPDCDGNKVEMSSQDGKILMFFPYTKTDNGNNGRVPLKGSPTDIEV